jgi:uncharacterized protein (TIGR03083 family)
MMPSEWISCYEDEALQAIDLAFANLEAPVPSCPGWTGRDLLHHLGITPHGWAVCLSTPIGALPDMKKIQQGPTGTPVDDESFMAWARAETKEWASYLRTLDPTAPVFTTTADKTLGFWMRHAAVETAVHLWDAEGISGTSTPIHTDLGSDGLDEVLLFVDYRRFRKDALPARSLCVAPTDAERTWTFPGSDQAASAPDEVRGEAGQFMLRLHGRHTGDFVGDVDTLEAWATLPPIQ